MAMTLTEAPYGWFPPRDCAAVLGVSRTSFTEHWLPLAPPGSVITTADGKTLLYFRAFIDRIRETEKGRRLWRGWRKRVQLERAVHKDDLGDANENEPGLEAADDA